MLASAVMPATAQIMLLDQPNKLEKTQVLEGWAYTYSFSVYSFSAEVSCSNSLLVTFLSAAKTIPSLDKMPIAVPACDMASSAYSTWYNRPSGEKMVVCRRGLS